MPKTVKLEPELAFRAFSDPTRLRLLNLLREGEVCVCDLFGVLGVPQPTASRHLATLRRAGLVVCRKQGLWCYYALAPATGAFHESLLECLRLSREGQPALAAEAVRVRKALKSRCCDA